MATKGFQIILAAVIIGAIVLIGAGCSEASDNLKVRSSASYDASVSETGGSAKESVPAIGEQSARDEAAGAVAAGGESPSSDPAFQLALDRKIVQTTTVDVGVEDVARAFTDIIAAAEAAGGFVAASVFSNSDDEQSADLTIRVPAEQYQSVLGKVRRIGDVSNESSDANDVTEEYTDLQARMRTLQATEQRYLDLLARADNINDILTVQDRLDGVRGQIEQAQGRIELLDHLTDLATITVHLRPIGAASSGGGGAHPIEAMQTAWQYSLDTLRGLATAGLVVVAFSWWIVPVAVVGLLVTRWWTNRKSRTTASGAA